MEPEELLRSAFAPRGARTDCLTDDELMGALSNPNSQAAHLAECDACFDAVVGALDVLEQAQVWTVGLAVTRDTVRISAEDYDRTIRFAQPAVGGVTGMVAAEERPEYGAAQKRPSFTVPVAGVRISVVVTPALHGAEVVLGFRGGDAKLMRLNAVFTDGGLLAHSRISPDKPFTFVVEYADTIQMRLQPMGR